MCGKAKTVGACGPFGFCLGTSLGTPITMIPPRFFHTLYHCPLSILRYPLSTVHYLLSTVHCPLSTVLYLLSIVHCPLSTVHCPLSTVKYALYTVKQRLVYSKEGYYRPPPPPMVHARIFGLVGRMYWIIDR